jgi:hypothetical protein
MDFYLKKNVLPKSVVKKTEINYEQYIKLIRNSCIADVIYPLSTNLINI